MCLTVNSVLHVSLQCGFDVLGELNSEKSGGIRGGGRETGEQRGFEWEWGTCCEESYRAVSLELAKLSLSACCATAGRNLGFGIDTQKL